MVRCLDRKGCSCILLVHVLITKLGPFCWCKNREFWLYLTGDESLSLTTKRVSTTQPLKQYNVSLSLFIPNEAFEYQFLPGLTHNGFCFLCSSPPRCKIYEECPSAHECLPHLIFCDRITTRLSAATGTLKGKGYIDHSEGKGDRKGREGEGK